MKKLDKAILNFKPTAFGVCLPVKFMVADKKVKELKEVLVSFSVTGNWVKDTWPTVKILEVL